MADTQAHITTMTTKLSKDMKNITIAIRCMCVIISMMAMLSYYMFAECKSNINAKVAAAAAALLSHKP